MDSFQERKHKNFQVESDPFIGHLWNQTLIGLTFDAVVRENIDEFEMDLAEAVKDAKDQFKTQGVDLSNLIIAYVKDPDTGELKHSNPVKGNGTLLIRLTAK